MTTTHPKPSPIGRITVRELARAAYALHMSPSNLLRVLESSSALVAANRKGRA